MTIDWISDSNSLIAYFSAREVVDQGIVKIVRTDASQLSEKERAALWDELWAAAENGSLLAACGCLGYLARNWSPIGSSVSAFQIANMLISRAQYFGYFVRAKIFERGLGRPVDLESAMRDFSIACRGTCGFPPAATHFSNFLMGQGKIRAAKNYAIRGYLLGDSFAALLLAKWCEDGLIDGCRDSLGALRWYERASDMGNYIATDRLIRVYQTGEFGVSVCLSRAGELSKLFDEQIRRFGDEGV